MRAWEESRNDLLALDWDDYCKALSIATRGAAVDSSCHVIIGNPKLYSYYK